MAGIAETQKSTLEGAPTLINYKTHIAFEFAFSEDSHNPILQINMNLWASTHSQRRRHHQRR